MKKTTALLAAAFTLAATLSVSACSKQGQVEEEPTAAADTLEGTVRQVGSTPFVRTVVEDEEGAERVVGELEEEIARAAGARVRVWGSWADRGDPGRALEAAGYELLAVDGVEPHVGVLGHESGRGYFLTPAEGEELPLTGVPAGLGERVGARVWVVLGEEGGVQRYGILREP